MGCTPIYKLETPVGSCNFNCESAIRVNSSVQSGYCDYILTASKEAYEIRTPVATLVEAKNESIKSGLGQCVAEMIAAQLFNQRNGELIESVYGAVTTGTDWKFLKLIHKRDYFINEVSRILGILTTPFQAFYPIEELSD